MRSIDLLPARNPNSQSDFPVRAHFARAKKSRADGLPLIHRPGARRRFLFIGRYAASLASLVLGRPAEARKHADAVRTREDFPNDVGDALAFLAAEDVAGYETAVESVLESFETRDEYLEDLPIADTVLVLQAVAEQRGMAAELSSPLLPPA